MKIPSFLLLLPFAGLTVAYGVEASVSVEIRLGKVLPPPPPEVIVIEQAAPPGPPPWAPARGFRRHRDYYYYPGADVYFRPEDRVWFYLDGREWRFGVSLPTNIRVDFDRSVSLRMEADQPFQFHNEVKVRYPADYFVTKVKVKEKNDKPEKGKSGGEPAYDSPGKSQGKGKGKNK
jgi:hypothetical protein